MPTEEERIEEAESEVVDVGAFFRTVHAAMVMGMAQGFLPSTPCEDTDTAQNEVAAATVRAAIERSRTRAGV